MRSSQSVANLFLHLQLPADSILDEKENGDA